MQKSFDFVSTKGGRGQVGGDDVRRAFRVFEARPSVFNGRGLSSSGFSAEF